MTEKPTPKATITLDTTGDPEFPIYQLSINAMLDETHGHGYRLMGPKYIGRSRNLRTEKLTQRDADEIRAVLDEAFPLGLRTLTPLEHDRAWHAIEGTAGAEDADPGTVLAAVLRALRINAPTAEDETAAILRKRTA
ncbi:hypothetical protein ABT154_21540 [Streptomyces sp. NPDC001728]|uniref:hypothetical protein n=1 Tax=Streptomyces sp. NPDC001728 TaxID=3154396 RepID=UPI0033253D4E